LVQEILKNLFHLWRQLSSELNGIPIHQLKTTAYWNSIHRQITLRKPYLTAWNRAKQLMWAQNNLSTDWKKVLFTDELAIEVGDWPRRPFVSHRKNQAYEFWNMVPDFHSNQFLVMVWASTAYSVKTDLLIIPLARRRMPSVAEH